MCTACGSSRIAASLTPAVQVTGGVNGACVQVRCSDCYKTQTALNLCRLVNVLAAPTARACAPAQHLVLNGDATGVLHPCRNSTEGVVASYRDRRCLVVCAWVAPTPIEIFSACDSRFWGLPVTALPVRWGVGWGGGSKQLSRKVNHSPTHPQQSADVLAMAHVCTVPALMD